MATIEVVRATEISAHRQLVFDFICSPESALLSPYVIACERDPETPAGRPGAVQCVTSQVPGRRDLLRTQVQILEMHAPRLVVTAPLPDDGSRTTYTLAEDLRGTILAVRYDRRRVPWYQAGLLRVEVDMSFATWLTEVRRTMESAPPPNA